MNDPKKIYSFLHHTLKGLYGKKFSQLRKRTLSLNRFEEEYQIQRSNYNTEVSSDGTGEKDFVRRGLRMVRGRSIVINIPH